MLVTDVKIRFLCRRLSALPQQNFTLSLCIRIKRNIFNSRLQFCHNKSLLKSKIFFEILPNDLFLWQVALRIRPLKREEVTRGYKAVATKVDDKVRFSDFKQDQQSWQWKIFKSIILWMYGVALGGLWLQWMYLLSTLSLVPIVKFYKKKLFFKNCFLKTLTVVSMMQSSCRQH